LDNRLNFHIYDFYSASKSLALGSGNPQSQNFANEFTWKKRKKKKKKKKEEKKEILKVNIRIAIQNS
jgi:hypothetical protein